MTDDEDELDAYEEQVQYLMEKWAIPREEAERLLENKRHE